MELELSKLMQKEKTDERQLDTVHPGARLSCSHVG